MKKMVRTIKVEPDKCSGCRSCEAVCSAYHAEPKHSIVNLNRSRIHVFRDEDNDVYVPLIAGVYTDVECNGRILMTIKGKEYGQCSFCRSSCPSRDFFKEPDNPDIPLKCDMCGEPPLPEPMCVKWCLADALTYVEKEEEVEEEVVRPEESQKSMEYLVNKYGIDEIKSILDQLEKG
jgi:benzoyl-CoA reductase subunit BamC